MSSDVIMNWKEGEIKTLDTIQSKIEQVKLCLESNNNDKRKQEFPPNSFESWHEVKEFLNEKYEQINSKLDQKQDIKIQSQKYVQSIENELKEIEILIEQLQSRKKEIEESLFSKAKQSQLLFDENFKEIENNQKTLKEMCNDVATFVKTKMICIKSLLNYSNKKNLKNLIVLRFQNVFGKWI